MPGQQFLNLLMVCFMTAALGGCLGTEARDGKIQEQGPAVDMEVVRLGKGGDRAKFHKIKEAFEENNQGYRLAYFESITSLEAAENQRILFVQEGQPKVQLSNGLKSPVTIGEIIILDPGIGLVADSALSVLEFVVPTAVPEQVPRFIRPDWDPNITDVPGGCATDTNAYRRILLTWKKEVGQYLYHDLNAHRVRITDSFSHYHPVEGGFDEFYLVQMALPDARIITSNEVGTIEYPEGVAAQQVHDLLKTTDLQVGDLVYLPRGVMHRGLGGVLAQVITVPGFIPGSEIGVDHHLKAINERLELSPNKALPYHTEAAEGPVIK
jgi:hypothetical protein